MNGDISSGSPPRDDPSPAMLSAWRIVLDDAPEGFGVTTGMGHVLVFANDSFLAELDMDRGIAVGRPLAAGGHAGLAKLLDRAADERRVVMDDGEPDEGDEMEGRSATAWPLRANGDGVDGVVIEVHRTHRNDSSVEQQRTIAERMLLSALREQEQADTARSAQARAAYLAHESSRLGESIDESTTLHSVAGLQLPAVAGWCIVDVIEEMGTVRRLGIVHPDASKQAVLRDLSAEARHPDAEPIGVWAIRQTTDAIELLHGGREALGLASHPGKVTAELDVGSLLTVPMRSHGNLLGAITFVGGVEGRAFTKEERDLAGDLASRGAAAIDNARLHGEAVKLRAAAQEASRIKSELLGHVSHELRTPLNAIGGFVDLLAMGVFGPVNADQEKVLQRMSANQKQLLVMIGDLLTFLQVQSGKLTYFTSEFSAHAFLSEMIEMLSPILVEKGLSNSGVSGAAGVIVRADRERAAQIVLNLLSNAVKFTPSGGRIAIDYQVTEDDVLIFVTDTGIGIPPDQLDSIFEPFVQGALGPAERKAGVGLGLAISKDLARRMDGELTAESTLGEGSRFTLRLPRAH